MDLGSLDLTSLTPVQFATLGAAVAAVDWLWGVLQAIRPPNVFSWAQVMGVLKSHVLERIVPIFALASFAWLVPATDPAHAGLYAAAAVGLLGYLGETAKSLLGTYRMNSALAAENAPLTPLTADAVPDDTLPGVPS